MKQKGFIHILIPVILSLVILVGLGYLAIKSGILKSQSSEAPSAPSNTPSISLNPHLGSPTPFSDKIANQTIIGWKTFVSQTAKFKFNYPNDWDSDIKRAFELVSLIKYNQSGITQYELTVGKLPEALSVTNCMKTISSEIIKIDNIAVKKELLRHNTNDSYLCYNQTRDDPNGQTSDPDEAYHLTFENNKQKYLLEFKYPASQASESQVLFNQILSTFQFTE